MQIKSCAVCQRQNYKLQKTSAALHPISVEGEAWHQLGMDLVGPLHKTPRGNKYIMTITDYYTKWAEACRATSGQISSICSKCAVHCKCYVAYEEVVIISH